MSPLGPGQRRPSRSPRTQRSRSADVDCLKKYTERRFEERKLTDVSDPNRLDSSKWIPLSRNVNRLRSSTRSYSEAQRNDIRDLETGRTKIDSTRWLPALNRRVCPENIRRNSQEKIEDLKYVKQPAGRSLSSESTFSRRENYFRERRNTEVGYYGRETYDKPRWLQSEVSTSRYIPSPLARKYSEGSTKPISNRWMTFTRYPSPSPIVRKNSDRRSFSNDNRRTDWSDRTRENMQTFSTTEHKAIQASKEPIIDSARLNQRIRELYDIKTETEWPKRLKHSLREDAWISKSSSEEDKHPISRSGRRNSQELEFNDRSSKFNESVEKPEMRPTKSTDSTFDNDWDERLRKFHEKLRFSEDLSIDKKIQARDRTYSDDYEDMSRRQSNDEHFSKDIKRHSDASSRSRVSYAEIDFSDFSKRGSRTSDASYVSISTYSPKRGSIESKNGTQTEIIPQRAFNQSEERRPSTPVPPKKMNDPVHIEKPFSQRSRRNSTRYKVYLT